MNYYYYYCQCDRTVISIVRFWRTGSMSDNFLFWSYCHEVRFEGKDLMKNFMTVSSETKLMFLKLAFNRVLRAPSNSCSLCIWNSRASYCAVWGPLLVFLPRLKTWATTKKQITIKTIWTKIGQAEWLTTYENTILLAACRLAPPKLSMIQSFLGTVP